VELPLSSIAEVRNEWIHASAPSMYLLDVDRDFFFCSVELNDEW